MFLLGYVITQVDLMNSLTTSLRNRNGFTLLELLIVIAIIALLMGISFSVMFGLVNQAEEEATIATVRKVDALLQQRMESFERAFKGNRKTAAVNRITVELARQNIFGVREDVSEILAKKAAFRFEFPQRMADRFLFALDPDTIVPGIPDTIFRVVAAPNARQFLLNENAKLQTPNPAFVPTDDQIRDIANDRWNGTVTPPGGVTIVFGGPAVPPSKTFTFSGNRQNTESSELLHFALLASGSYGVGAVDGDRFRNTEVADTDDDGLPEFIDAWGNPLRFYRWPTRLIDITAPTPFTPVLSNPSDNTDTRQIVGAEREVANSQFKGLSPPPLSLPNGVVPRDLLLTDPDDPVGRLYSELERLDGNDGRPLFSIEFNEINYHTPETYHTPLIVSAGYDGLLGLREPNDTDFPNGIFGNLAQLAGTTAISPNQSPTAAVREQLPDNITNRNRRAGGRR